MLAETRVRVSIIGIALLDWGGSLRSCDAQAVVIASATLGATGQIGGTSVTATQFVGWRFAVAEPLVIERVGGHLFGDVGAGGVFAAVVSLPAIDAFPAGDPFTAEEVVATTVFEPPVPSADVRTPLNAVVGPGAYALVFGTGLFGATGEAALPRPAGQADIPPSNISSFIFYGFTAGPGSPKAWRTNLASHMRFVIEGRAPIAADFDDDGDVDAVDLSLWQGGYGATAGAARIDGDANANGAVDATDFLAWQQGLGTTVSEAAVHAVPELAWSSAAMLCFFGAAVRLMAGERRR